MSATYQAIVTARCWKQHTCCACGCVYRYALEKSGKGQRGLHEGAQQEAEERVFRKLRTTLASRPCPTCGLIQPDMVAKSKLLWHGLLTGLAFLPLMVFIGMGSAPSANGALPTDLCAMLAAAVAGGVALLHLGIALANPNSDLEGNRKKAEAEIAAYRMEIVAPGSTSEPSKVPANLTALHCLALLGLFLAAPAFLAAVYLRTSNGWANNADLRPELIGPGDEFKVELPARHVQAIQGFWRGEAAAKVQNSAPVADVKTLKASTRTESWGDSLRVKRSEKTRSIHPFARLTMPDDEALGGKTLKVSIHLNITYPTADANSSFVNDKTTVTRDITVQITPRECRDTYWLTWAIGVAVGALGCLGGGLLLLGLAQALRGRALPNSVVPMGA